MTTARALLTPSPQDENCPHLNYSQDSNVQRNLVISQKLEGACCVVPELPFHPQILDPDTCQ